MSKKSILITTPYLNKPGGVASFYTAVIPFLKNYDHDIEVLQIGSSNTRYSLFKVLLDQINFYKALSDNISIVHLNPSLGFKSFVRDGLFAIIAKHKKKPVIIFFHGWNKRFEHVIKKYLKFFFNLSYGCADAFIVLASEFESSLRELGIKTTVYVETTAIDEQLISDFNIDHKIQLLTTVCQYRILFLSRLEREKGVFETIDAVKILIDQGLPVTLSIAGSGPILEELKQYVADNQLAEHYVKFLGYVSGTEKKRVFIEHDLYCFPTNYGEGLPISVLEAMLFGLPVITRPVGGLADQFEDGMMGKLCHSMRPDEIAQAIQSLIVDQSTMSKIARYNHFHALNKFMASKVASRLFKIYQSLLR